MTVGGSIVVRLADDSDAELISSWTRAAEVSQFWGGHEIPLDDVLAKYTGRRAPEVVSYVITESGQSVGYLQAWQGGERFGLDMFLSAEAQGRGIGSRTAHAMAVELTARGWTPLTVDPASDNARAIRAWRSAGFVPSGELGTDDGRTTQIMYFSAGEAAIQES
ncbi:GNAT family N-acetyltransferase [Flexivirga alba]|uniref:GNAT family N-acetyltransferase n=1 Tax=Flexivirga alba TaxID=702742 RepID=A0ABW2ACP4_9MICO